MIELIIVMVLLGLLALIAIPKFTDLSDEAKIAATQAALASVRSAVSLKYAYEEGGPSSIAPTDFTNDGLPFNKLSGKQGVENVASVPGGTATSSTFGFWYLINAGQSGTYSDGSIDTSLW